MTIQEFAAKFGCTQKDAKDFLEFHNIPMFRGQIDLKPSILSSIVEAQRLSSGIVQPIRSKDSDPRSKWFDGRRVELIEDIHKFKKDDTVLYGKSLYVIDRKFNDNDNKYWISSILDNKNCTEVDGSNLTLVRVVE